MTRVEFLLARRKYTEFRSLYRVGLLCGIAVVVMLALRYAPGTKAERPHFAIVGAEILAVLLGLRYLDKSQARRLIKANRLNCPECSANLIADGGAHAILHGQCAQCRAGLFENARDFELTVATVDGALTRSQFLRLRMASERVEHPVVDLVLSCMALMLPLTAFWAAVRYPDSREFFGIGVFFQYLMALLLLVVFASVSGVWYRRYVRSPLDCPRCRRKSIAGLARSEIGPDGRCRKCRTVVFVEDPADRSLWSDPAAKFVSRQDLETARAAIKKLGRRSAWALILWGIALIPWVSLFDRFILAHSDKNVRLMLGMAVLGVWLAAGIVGMIWMTRANEKIRAKFDLVCPSCELPWADSQEERRKSLDVVLAWGCCPRCFEPVLNDFQGRDDARIEEVPRNERWITIY